MRFKDFKKNATQASVQFSAVEGGDKNAVKAACRLKSLLSNQMPLDKISFLHLKFCRFGTLSLLLSIGRTVIITVRFQAWK